MRSCTFYSKFTNYQYQDNNKPAILTIGKIRIFLQAN